MNIIIAGTGEVGFYLSKLLAQESHNIVIIDHNKKKFKEAYEFSKHHLKSGKVYKHLQKIQAI